MERRPDGPWYVIYFLKSMTKSLLGLNSLNGLKLFCPEDYPACASSELCEFFCDNQKSILLVDWLLHLYPMSGRIICMSQKTNDEEKEKKNFQNFTFLFSFSKLIFPK